MTISQLVMTSLIYSDHAVIRMEQRNINHALVVQIINFPDGRIKQSLDKEILYKRIKLRKDNLIALVLVGKHEVLTVMNFFEII